MILRAAACPCRVERIVVPVSNEASNGYVRPIGKNAIRFKAQLERKRQPPQACWTL